MRKIICVIIGAAVLLAAAGLTACGGKTARNSYSITAEYFPEERLLSAEMTVTVPNLAGNALSELKFELWPNAYREGATYRPVSELFAPSAYYRGESYGGIAILSLSGAEGFEVTGEDENILTVTLSEPLYPDETVSLTIAFEVTLAEINHRLGVGEHSVNLANFYPVLCTYGENGFSEYVYSYNGDPFVSECADYDVTLTVPAEYTAVYSGTGDSVAQNGKKTYHVVAENARDVAFVLGNYECVRAQVGETAVEYYYFQDPSPQTALSAATDSFGYFSETFGGYEYPCYKVVETDFPYGGMEYPMLSLISCDLQESEIARVVAHETAHQWWYAMVGSNQFESSWQDEGLAEYSVALFLGAFPQYGGSYADFIRASENAYRAYFSVYSQLSDKANTAMDRPLTSYTGEYEYRNIAYDKGVILFDRVRSVTGDGKFFAALKQYKKQYAGKIASPANLISCFERAGANVEGVILSFTDGLCVI